MRTLKQQSVYRKELFTVELETIDFGENGIATYATLRAYETSSKFSCNLNIQVELPEGKSHCLRDVILLCSHYVSEVFTLGIGTQKKMLDRMKVLKDIYAYAEENKTLIDDINYLD